MVIKEKHVRFIAIIVMVSIVLSGATIFSYVRVPRVWLTGLIGFVFWIFGGSHVYKKSLISKFFFAWVIFLGINYFISYSPDNTLDGLLVFVSLYFMMHIRLKESNIELMLIIMRVICIIYAVSILLSATITGPFYAIFSGLIAQSMNFIRQEIATGSYSGVVGERALAAYFMNVGMVIELSKYFVNKKMTSKNYFLIFLYSIALMMTGKRMLFAIALVLVAAVIVFSEAKGKYAKAILIACILIPIALIVINLIPQTQVLLQRIVQYSGDDMLNGRQFFWDYCLLMFKRKPWMGYGFDTFNTAFADEVNYVYKGRVWDMYAHNIYYELLGEVGLIGTAIFVLLLGYSLYKTAKLMKCKSITNEQKGLLYCALGFQLMFIIYGFTGNCLYENEQLMLCFIGILIYTVILREVQKKEDE